MNNLGLPNDICLLIYIEFSLVYIYFLDLSQQGGYQ